jgi:hypothetical protein
MASHPVPPDGPAPYPLPNETINQMCSRFAKDRLAGDRAHKKEQTEKERVAEKEKSFQNVPAEKQALWPSGLRPPSQSDISSTKRNRSNGLGNPLPGQQTLFASMGVEPPSKPLAAEEEEEEEVDDEIEAAADELRESCNGDAGDIGITSDDLFADGGVDILAIKGIFEKKHCRVFLYTVDAQNAFDSLKETLSAGGESDERFVLILSAESVDGLNTMPACKLIDLKDHLVYQLKHQAQKKKREHAVSIPAKKLAESITRLINKIKVDGKQFYQTFTLRTHTSTPAIHRMHRNAPAYTHLQQLCITLSRHIATVIKDGDGYDPEQTATEEEIAAAVNAIPQTSLVQPPEPATSASPGGDEPPPAEPMETDSAHVEDAAPVDDAVSTELQGLGLKVLRDAASVYTSTVERKYSAFLCGVQGAEVALVAGFSTGVYMFAVGGVENASESTLTQLVTARSIFHSDTAGLPEPLPFTGGFELKLPVTWANYHDPEQTLAASIDAFMKRTLPSVADAPVGITNGPLRSHIISVPSGAPSLADLKLLQTSYCGMYQPDLVNIGIWTDGDTTRDAGRGPDSEPAVSTIVPASMPPPEILTKIRAVGQDESFNSLGLPRTRYFDDPIYDSHIRSSVQFFRGEELANDRFAKIVAICEHVRGGVIYDRMFAARTTGDTDKRVTRKAESVSKHPGQYTIVALERQQGAHGYVWVALLVNAAGDDCCFTMQAGVNHALDACSLLLEPYVHHAGNRIYFIQKEYKPIGTLDVHAGDAALQWYDGHNKVRTCSLSIISPTTGEPVALRVPAKKPSGVQDQEPAVEASQSGTSQPEDPMSGGIPQEEAPHAAEQSLGSLNRADILVIHRQQWAPNELFTINGAAMKGQKWVLDLKRERTGQTHKCFAGTGIRGYCSHDLPFDACGTCYSPQTLEAHLNASKNRDRISAPVTAELFTVPCVLRVVKINAKDAYSVVVKKRDWQYMKPLCEIPVLGNPATGLETIIDMKYVNGSEFTPLKGKSERVANVALVRTITSDVFQIDPKREMLQILQDCIVDTGSYTLVHPGVPW